MKNNSRYKIISFILAVSLIIGTVLVYSEDSQIILSDVSSKYIKVGILYGNTAAEAVKLESDNGFILADVSNNGWGAIKQIYEYKELYIINYADYGIVVLMSEDGELLVPMAEQYGVMAAGTEKDNLYITINGKKYRDGACFSLDDNGLFNVSNYVSAEHYLWGVLNSEIGTNYPTEAIKAMAVACRTFAYANIGKHAGTYGFDVCCNSDCQVYGGVASERTACTQACKATENLVIKSNGNLINAVHSAGVGGYTINSEDAWVGKIDYLRSVKDEYTPITNWSLYYSLDQIAEKLLNKGIDVGEVINVSVSEKTSYGAVLGVTIEGTKDTVTVTKSNMKSIFSLKSQMFDIVPSGGAIAASSDVLYVYIIDDSGDITEVPVSDIVISDGNDTIEGSILDWSAIGHIKETSESAVQTELEGFIFKGSGSGHGVGLSQTGCKAMASAGKTFDEILKYYYTGVVIENI